jgi:hypothetical protein
MSMKKLILIVVGLITFSAATLLMSGPVLFRSPWHDSCCSQPSLVILNPIRARSVEDYADSVLAGMRGEPCERVVAGMAVTDERRRYVCEKQKEHPLISWELKDRHDEGQRSDLRYLIRYQGSEYTGQLWITVEKTGGGWQVISYAPIY